MTPRIPPVIIRIDNCNTIGLHSDNIKRYAYRKNAAIHRMKIVIPVPLRLSNAVKLVEMYLLVLTTYQAQLPLKMRPRHPDNMH